MKIVVVAPFVPKDIKNLIDVKKYSIYACDSAVEELVNQGIKIDLAIGDFDSLKNIELLKGIETVKLKPEKNDSDAHHAIKLAYEKTNDVVLLGGIKGNRSDHFVGNLLLLAKYKNLTIIDDYNKIVRLGIGTHYIYKDNFKYLSLFPVSDSIISISGVKYPLNNYRLQAYDVLGLSNEIINEVAELTLKEGVLIAIQSN